ncbi:DSD1 family PLP-dependent enzyme [Polaromonas naphthalenivorans]|uniref:Putative threonine aldolase n=1 Tax=Polaromonas naphthalenivorans (strain CJ2) TaxID=365044 RepID=A1VJK6_POLNA|nr:DSD1 family PLP-dependent enzyme [Polaromonas naphthalenivorans]ABM35834.1 putative threonine aldolase [Polaromonas naphthalenivorans CJ2]
MSNLPARLSELIGKPVHDIDTPALVIDMDALKRNLVRMADFAKKHHVRWRPHAKLHKSTVLAKMQIKAGAAGVCVQKTAEAEVMVAGGIYNVYISNQVIAPAKLARVAALTQAVASHRGGQIAIAVDSPEGVSRLAKAMTEARTSARSSVATVIDVFVEIDVGQGRCGAQPGEAAVKLALEIRKHPALRFAGLQAYQGKAQHLRSAIERRMAAASATKAVELTCQLLKAHGIAPGLVTGAGTGSFALEAASGVYGELQAGSFMFMDVDYAQNERDPAQPQFEHALFVKTQVISTHASHAVCDAGHKSHAIDSGMPKVHAFEKKSGLDYFNGGDEHGILRPVDGSDRLPALGQLLWLIPGHCDPTVNLHDVMIGVSGGLRNGTVDRIIQVDARGAMT